MISHMPPTVNTQKKPCPTLRLSPPSSDGEGFEHGSILSGKSDPSWVRSQRKSTPGAHEVFFEGDGPQFCFLRHMSPMALRSPCATVNIGSAETTPTRHRSRHTRAAPSARYISLTTRTRVIASVSSPPRTRGSHARTVQPVPWHRPAAEEVCVTAQFLPKNLGSECKSRYRGALDALAAKP